MQIGKKIFAVNSEDDNAFYMVPILQFTSELFFLLEAVEKIESQAASGERRVDAGFGPSILSVELHSVISNKGYAYSEEFGCNGRLAQLAYVGWVAAVDGAWEKYRKSAAYKEYGSGLKHGMQAGLFGDLHKIRNDLLKHGGVAQAANTGKCTVLKWFKSGDRIHLTINHVLDFMHRLGMYLSSFHYYDKRMLPSTLMVQWLLRDQSGVKIPKVISFRIIIEKFPKARGFGLFICMVFADGIPATGLLLSADDQNDLVEDMERVQNAPLSDYNAPVMINIPWLYRMSLDSLKMGKQPPFNPGLAMWLRPDPVSTKRSGGENA